MRNSYIFIQENAFENVFCEMASILCRPQCVKFRCMDCITERLNIYARSRTGWQNEQYCSNGKFSRLYDYRKVSNIRRTKYQNLNASRLIL